MKIIMALTILGVALVSVVWAQPSVKSPPKENENGRYQLVSSEYIFSASNTNQPEHDTDTKTPATFKIDTKTGKTWIYEDRLMIVGEKTKVVIGWTEIDDSVPLSRQK